MFGRGREAYLRISVSQSIGLAFKIGRKFTDIWWGGGGGGGI